MISSPATLFLCLGILYCGEKAEIENALNIAAEEGEWHRKKKKMCKNNLFLHQPNPSLIGLCNLLNLSQIMSSFRLSTAVNF